jgi:DNA ligase-1
MSASWINKLNEDNGRLHKEDVLKQALEAAVLGSENSRYFLMGLKACYNPFNTYGVKQIPDSVGITDAENPWQDFAELLEALSKRKLTGHAARDAIQEMSERFDSEEWNLFLAPILRRDMRCGISSTTINKIAKNTEYEIPVFSCQLATNSEGRPEMKGIKRLEPKLDGVRVLMTVGFPDYGGIHVTCYSRNGKIFENFHHIEAQIENYAMELLEATKVRSGGFVLDGEVVGNSFQELMRQARRKEDVQNDDSVFHIFDVVPIDDFLRGHWNAQLSKRLAILEKMQPTIDKMANVELLPHIQVDLDTEEGQAELQTYAQAMVAAGYEGIMIKDLDAPYECARSKSWLKWKPTITVDLEVIGIEEGTGRNMGRLGALVCAGNDHGKDIVVNAGSGFSDKERKQLWEDRNVIFGRTVEIMADAVTQNQDGTYSLRFPRFVRFRDDKA